MPPDAPDPAAPLVVALDMGYGHLRPAAALAEALGTEVLAFDQPPLASTEEVATWHRARRAYERLTRWSQAPLLGAPVRTLLTGITGIEHLHPHRDQSRPDWTVRRLGKAIAGGLGAGLVDAMRASGRPLLTTYFAPAHAADAAGLDRVHLVVTDSDIHRIWAPADAASSRIRYLVPTIRASRRLMAYGVSRLRIHVTGFPLPGELLGPGLVALRRNLAARLVRLDPDGLFRDALSSEVRAFLGRLPAEEEGRAPLLTFAVGGTGAQAGMARRFLPSLRPEIDEGRLRLALVAGVREDVEARLRRAVASSGLTPRLGDGIEILRAPDVASYFRAFNALLARTDVLWTKPSELTFFGALGLALVLAPPIGTHEWYNRRYARENGAGLKQRQPHHAGQWLREWLDDGLLAAAAWNGFARLPKEGLTRIVDLVRSGP